MKRLPAGVIGLLVLLASAPAAHAAPVTWVSSAGGDDANPCTRTAPCFTYAGAISKTDAGGTIRVLAPGGYGPVTITKSVTIDAAGTFASTSATGNSAIVVNGANIDVTLRGLTLETIAPCSATGTASGIKYVAGRSLHVENTKIRGFSGYGIDAEPAGGGSLSVTGTEMTDNCTGGLLAASPGGINTTLTDSFISHSGTAIGAGGGGRVELARNVVTGNTTGLSATGSGALASWGNNRVGGNGTDGTPTEYLTSPPPPPTVVTQTVTQTIIEAGPPGPTANSPVVCIVPGLAKKTLSGASSALTKANCRLGKITYRPKRGKKAKRIYAQSPAAGWQRAAGAKVAVTVNMKPPKRKARAHAAIGAASRTWVASTGNDANPCSRTAPCATFQGALVKAIDGGVISVADSGDFGPVVLSGSTAQGITIDGGGNNVLIAVGAGNDAITVNAPDNRDVTLRNMSLVNTTRDCTQPALGSGIRYLQGRALHLYNVTARNFDGSGLELTPSATGPVDIQGGSFTENCNAGIAAQNAQITADGTTFSHNGTGILAGPSSVFRLTRNTISGNATGLSTISGGSIFSWGDNNIGGNASDGVTPTTLQMR